MSPLIRAENSNVLPLSFRFTVRHIIISSARLSYNSFSNMVYKRRGKTPLKLSLDTLSHYTTIDLINIFGTKMVNYSCYLDKGLDYKVDKALS